MSITGASRPADGLTAVEVARRAGTTPERVRELVALGILTPGPDPGAPFRHGDTVRVRFVEELEEAGIPPASVAEAVSRGALTLAYLDALPDPAPRSATTYAELCGELGLRFGLLDRIFAGFGLPLPHPDEHVRQEDLAIISGLPILFAAGLGNSEVLRAARVWGDGPRRVAQHQVHSFHEIVEEPYRRQGLSDDQALAAAFSAFGAELIPFCERLVGWLYRRHFETYATEHRVSHVETALQEAGLHPKPAPHFEACVFADISGYTSVIEELGDDAAGEMALRLADLMQDVADRHRGRVVKMLGDGVHFIFHEPSDAVVGSLEIVERAEIQGLPPAHVGVNAGPMIYTDGDYYGLAIILAARIAAEAGPGQVLVGESIAEHWTSEGVRFEEIAPVSLKGVAHPVSIYRAHREAPAS
jgi:adenylate cyclase